MNNLIDKEVIKRIIQSKEYSKVDFKKEWYATTNKNNHEIIKDFIALSNGNIFSIGKPAYLIVGVQEKENNEKLLFDIKLSKDIATIKKQILQNLKSYAEPPVQDFELEYVMVKNKNLVIVEIPQHPYLIKLKKGLHNNHYRVGDILYRSGESTEVASLEVANKHMLALERYNLKLRISEDSKSFSGIEVEDAEQQPEIKTKKNLPFSVARKICLINAASFGMSTITAGILRPKHPTTNILQIYGSTSFLRAANSTAIPVHKIYEILETVIKQNDLIVDISSYVAFEFLNGLADYEGSANDFDRFVIPTQSSLYAHGKTVYTIERLLDFGVSPKKIRIIFNMHQSYKDDVTEAFQKTIEFLEENGIPFDKSIIIPKDRGYFKHLYSSPTEEFSLDRKTPVYDLYHLEADGTNGTILHKRARNSLIKCFSEINKYIYQ